MGLPRQSVKKLQDQNGLYFVPTRYFLAYPAETLIVSSLLGVFSWTTSGFQ